jgi:hypothetical protein
MSVLAVVQQRCERAASFLISRTRGCNSNVLIVAAILAGNLLILGPYISTLFTNQPWNNGYGYIAMARVFRDFKWSWNPLIYCGAPLSYLYPPLFHVLLGVLPFSSLGRSYHLLTAVAYAIIPACIYMLGLVLFRSRALAAFAAILYSVFPSPAYYFLPQWEKLAAPYADAPWGYVALVRYEEAAHALAFVFALLAITAAWRNRWTLAGLLTATVCLTSWPGMIGLGMILAAVALAKTHKAGARDACRTIFGVVGVGFGLAAFWITPGYMLSVSLANRVVLRHTLLVGPWNRITWIILALATVMLGLALWRRISPELAFLLAWLGIAGAVILAFTLAGSSLLPMAHRYMLEFNAGLVMAVTGLISLLRNWRRAAPVAALVILGAGAPLAFRFIGQAWKVQPHDADPSGTVVYKLAGWLNQHADGARVMASGEFDPELFLWSDVPQVGGPGQGISNYLVFAAQRQIAFGCGNDSERIAELWLRALSIRYLVVHGGSSGEYFHWFAKPEKFATLPVAWDNGTGDTIYEVPTFDGHDAVVVDLPAIDRLPRLTSTSDASFLKAYVAWAAGKRPASLRWGTTDSAALDAELGPDEGVLVKFNDDRGWRVNGATVGSDPIGFLLIRARPGRQHLVLQFGASWDLWLGRGITLLTAILLISGAPKHRIACLAVIPAVAAFGFLCSTVPPAAKVAEEAFSRLQPPIISPGGIVDAITQQPSPFARGRVLQIYGVGFGTSADSTRLWLNGRAIEITDHELNAIAFKLPWDTPSKGVVSVEVNGCQGNEFTLEAR